MENVHIIAIVCVRITLIRKEHQTVGFRSENMQLKKTMPNERFLRKSMVAAIEKQHVTMIFV